MPFERLRAIARHGGDDRTLVTEAADCLAEFDDDPAGLVVACRRLLHHHAECGPLWWLCARVLAAAQTSEAAWAAEQLVRDDRTPARLAALLPFPHDEPIAVVGWPELVGEALGTDLAKVMELKEDGETLFVRAGVGWKPGVVGEATVNVSDATSEVHALKTCEPMISPDIAKETRFSYPRFLIDNGVQAMANVPIMGAAGEQPFGILQIDSREPRQFTDNDTAFLRT